METWAEQYVQKADVQLSYISHDPQGTGVLELGVSGKTDWDKY